MGSGILNPIHKWPSFSSLQVFSTTVRDSLPSTSHLLKLSLRATMEEQQRSAKRNFLLKSRDLAGKFWRPSWNPNSNMEALVDILCSVDQNRLFKHAKRTSYGWENRFFPKVVFLEFYRLSAAKGDNRKDVSCRKGQLSAAKGVNRKNVSCRKPVFAIVLWISPRSQFCSLDQQKADENEWIMNYPIKILKLLSEIYVSWAFWLRFDLILRNNAGSRLPHQ